MNIILLLSDTFRYDNLFDRAAAGPMGMPVRTPCLDRFAERAVSCSGMYTSSFPTIPHRTDLTSGRFGWPWHGWQVLQDSTANHAPAMLGAKGYSSQLLCDCPHLFKHRFDAGFNAAHVVRGQEGDVFFLRKNHPVEHVMPPAKTRHGEDLDAPTLDDWHHWTNRNWRRNVEADRFAPRTAALAMEWLEENNRSDEPLLLWVDFFDPHEPWDPPEYMVRRYDPDYDGVAMTHPNYGRSGDYTPAELKNMRAHYCAEAEMVDRWVGRVIEKIDDLQMWDDSIVVFSTDHGMSVGEHERVGKCNINPGDDRAWPLYPEIAHIPFMIAAPGLEGGREVAAPVSPPDILPTLLELAGVQVDPPEPLHGRSFAGRLRGETDVGPRDCAVSAGHIRLGDDGQPPSQGVMPCVYTERWCYAPYGPTLERELFDLTDDPYCTRNVLAGNESTADDLHTKLLALLDEVDAPPEAIEVFRT